MINETVSADDVNFQGYVNKLTKFEQKIFEGLKKHNNYILNLKSYIKTCWDYAKR